MGEMKSRIENLIIKIVERSKSFIEPFLQYVIQILALDFFSSQKLIEGLAQNVDSRILMD